MDVQTLIGVITFIAGLASWADYCVTHTSVIRNTWEYFFTRAWQDRDSRFPLVLIFLLVLGIAAYLLLFIPNLPNGLVGCLVGLAGIVTRLFQSEPQGPDPLTESRKSARKLLAGGALVSVAILIVIFVAGNVESPQGPALTVAAGKQVDAHGAPSATEPDKGGEKVANSKNDKHQHAQKSEPAPAKPTPVPPGNSAQKTDDKDQGKKDVSAKGGFPSGDKGPGGGLPSSEKSFPGFPSGKLSRNKPPLRSGRHTVRIMKADGETVTIRRIEAANISRERPTYSLGKEQTLMTSKDVKVAKTVWSKQNAKYSGNLTVEGGLKDPIFSKGIIAYVDINDEGRITMLLAFEGPDNYPAK